MDEAKLNEFMGKLVNDMGGAAMLASVILGEELGLYRALVHGKPTSPEQLASDTHCHPRLVREWLNAQAASGYLEHERGLFRLPPEQAMALAEAPSSRAWRSKRSLQWPLPRAIPPRATT